MSAAIKQKAKRVGALFQGSDTVRAKPESLLLEVKRPREQLEQQTANVNDEKPAISGNWDNLLNNRIHV